MEKANIYPEQHTISALIYFPLMFSDLSVYQNFSIFLFLQKLHFLHQFFLLVSSAIMARLSSVPQFSMSDVAAFHEPK